VKLKIILCIIMSDDENYPVMSPEERRAANIRFRQAASEARAAHLARTANAVSRVANIDLPTATRQVAEAEMMGNALRRHEYSTQHNPSLFTGHKASIARRGFLGNRHTRHTRHGGKRSKSRRKKRKKYFM
jgi:hypothetical protein